MDKLDRIITQLDELEYSQKRHEDQIKHNSTTLLLKIPKALLIQRICGYLDDNDLYKLAGTCSTLRKIIFCPLGFKLLMLSRNAHHLVGSRPQPITYQKEKFELGQYAETSSRNHFEEEEDAIAQVHTLRAVKDFLTKKLQESISTIRNQEDMIDELSATLKYEKSVNLKLQSKINILQNQLYTSELQRQDVKENLTELNAKYNKIITQMEQERNSLTEENQKLIGHKKVLVDEVYRLRALVQQMETSQNNYKEALKQVRNFMDSIELKPIN
ncbi:hypothetical protein pb186bvf_011992 [Paramecium bursaria]